MSIGIGLTVNNTKAVFEALFKQQSEFARTPKYRIEAGSDEWIGKKYRQNFVVQPIIELALGLYFTATVFYALANGIYGTVPFLVLFQIGFLYTGLLSIIQQYAGDEAVELSRHGDQADRRSCVPPTRRAAAARSHKISAWRPRKQRRRAAERQSRARRRRRDVVGDLLSRWRARRARLLRLRHPRPGPARDVRGGLLPALASPAADARAARRSAVAAGGGATAARGDHPPDAQPAAGRWHGRAADGDVGAGALRRRGQRRVAPGAVPQGGSSHGADGHHRRHLGPDAGGRRTDCARSGDGPGRQFPLHADGGSTQRAGGESLRRRAHAARRPRAERLDVRRRAWPRRRSPTSTRRSSRRSAR